MTRKLVQIFTDSRGQDLEPFLANQLPRDQVTVKVHVRRGATLEKAIEHLKREADTNTDLIIIAAGICNLTHKESRGRTRTLTYTSSEENLILIKDTLTALSREFQNKLIIATIPPASLVKYYSHFNNTEPPSFLTDQQNDLLRDTEELNQYIITLNKAANLQTIYLHKQCFNTSLDRKKKTSTNPGKRRRIFLEKLFTDGVHSNSTLQYKWFNRYYSAINGWLQQLSSSDTENEGPGAWDYKRNAGADEPSTSRE